MAKTNKLLRYDWTNLRAEVVGAAHGLAQAEIDARAGDARKGVESIRKRVEGGELGFPRLPFDKEPARAILRYARAWRGKYDSVLVLGIGGSALGPFSVDVLVNGPHPFRRKNVPAEMVVLDNVDPLVLGRALERLNPKRTLALVITKSGSTAETMSQFLIVYDWLKRKLGQRAARQVAAVTDPKKGDLLDIGKKEGFALFSVPANIGGRFSVLSPVGLLPAALVGADIEALLAGARAMAKICEKPSLEENLALSSALHMYLLDTRHNKSIQVVYCYSNALWPLAFWYRQLWAESLGKRVDRNKREVNCGQTPVAALGVTDQHSQSQLYMEGPRDKVITFWEVEQDAYRVKIPRLFPKHDSTGYLGGRTLNELFHAEKLGTELALTEAGRPNCSLIFPAADEHALGQYMMLAEYQTAYAGEFYNVNAFDQPGVELGKNLTYALLGRAGYDAERARIAAFQKQKAALQRG